jgi:hypothetical protein
METSELWGIVGAVILLLAGARFILDAFFSETFTISGRGRRDPSGPRARWYHRILMLLFGTIAVVFGIVQLISEIRGH